MVGTLQVSGYQTMYRLRITYEIKPRIFDEKRGIAALLIKNSGFYFIFNPQLPLKQCGG